MVKAKSFARPVALAFVAALAIGPLFLPVGGAQLPPTPLDDVLKGTISDAAAMRESVVGPELSREDVDIHLDMEFRDVDFDTINVIFGGGKFSANARITARIDLRVLSATRVSEAVNAALPGAENLTTAANTERSFIPADVFRASLAGEALAAFQGEQEAKLAAYLRKTIPNVTVMNTAFAWSNFTPEDSLENGASLPGTDDPTLAAVNDPTFPPITLAATIDVQYLERTSLLEIVDKVLASKKTDRQKAQEAQVADAAASYDRSAFGLMGIRQVLDLQAPAGWNLIVTVRLPQGYTFEEASPDVFLRKDLREANVLTLGKDANAAVFNPVALTLSNRYIVSVAMLSVVLLVGNILRFPVVLAANAVRRKLRT